MKNLLLAVLLFCFSFSYAQISFEKGYYITTTGDRIECFIKNIDWKDNPRNFEYKTQIEDSQSNIGTISTVKEFGIDNISKYKRFNVNIDRSSNDLKELSQRKNPIWKEETLFLKLLVEGDANLYGFSGDNLTRYFYETKDVPLEQLVYIRYYADDSNGMSYKDNIKENNQFRQQLYNNVRCINTSERDLKKIIYRKSALIEHFTKFNSCSSNAVVNYEAKIKRPSFSLKITPGINLASLSISDPNRYYNKSTDMKGKTVFKIGIEGEYILPFNKNKWSIFLNPTYQKFEAEKTYVNNDGFGVLGQDLTHKVQVDYNSIEIPIGLRHNIFLNKNSKLFVNAMYVFDFSWDSSIEFNDNKKMEIYTRNNIALGLGYNFKSKYSIELRVNTAREILGDFISWSAKYNTTGIVLGYKIL